MIYSRIIAWLWRVWVTYIQFHLATGTIYSCADKGDAELNCTGMGTDGDPKICFCEKDDCNTPPLIDCHFGGGLTSTLEPKIVKTCDIGTLDCKNVTKSKYILDHIILFGTLEINKEL